MCSSDLAKLFTLPPAAMYRRPARDRNYEFWGNQVFYGENPPQMALISYFTKSKPKDVTLKITDATGREVREIAVPERSLRAGIDSACWDLRVQPIPAPDTGRGQRAGGGQGGGQGGTQETSQPAPEPFGYGCGGGTAAGGGGGGGFGGFGGGGGTPGPFVLPGSYNVALVVDGTSIETKPLRVVADPEVVLTEAQRKQMFDMAMEMHEIQKRTTEAAAGVASLNRQLTQLSTDIGARNDIPADVKSSLDSLKADVTAMVPKLPTAPAGGRGGGGGGGRGGADTSVVGRVAAAKNGLMAGMWPTSVTMKAFNDAKTDAPKALSDANALFAKAASVSTSLAKYNLTLTAPKPVDTAVAAKKKTV